MFIDNLKDILRDKNIKFSKMCSDLGFAQSIKNKWEDGQMPKIDKLRDICLYLNVSADRLLDIDNEKDNINYLYNKADERDRLLIDTILDKYKNIEGKLSDSKIG